MIEAIAALGEYVKNSEDVLEVDMFCEKEQFSGREIIIAKVELTKENDSVQFKNVTYKQYEETDYRLLLYRKPPSSGPGFSPSNKFINPDKTLNKKIIKFFETEYPCLESEESALLQNMGKCIKGHFDVIASKIEEIKNVGKKQEIVITVALGDEFPLNIEAIKKVFLYKSWSDLGDEYKDRFCCCCSEKKVVYDNGLPFKFFTLDKLGYAYGFDNKHSHKMLPICKDCAIKLRLGRKYIKEHLNYSFYSSSYLLVPQFLTKIDPTILSRLIDQADFTTKKKARDVQKFEEEQILRKITKNLDDALSMTLMFNKDDGKRFLIYRVVEDVFPSRFIKIFDTIDKINRTEVLQKLFTDIPSMKFNFGVIRNFFPRTNCDDKFMDIVSSVLLNTKIDYIFISKNILNKIVSVYNSKQSFDLTIIRGFLFMQFLQELDLIKNFSEGDIMENRIKGKRIDKLNEFLEKNSRFYNTNEKRVCFLVGVLVRELIRKQDKELKSSPFLKQLKGFQLNQRELRQLLTKTVNKMEQYDIEKYNKDIIASVSQYFSITESDWKLSNVDINFYLLLGLSLADKILFKSEEEDTNE